MQRGMIFRRVHSWLGAGVMTLAVATLGDTSFCQTPPASAQTQKVRLVKTKRPPVYPELARRLNIVGIVKVELVVAPNGHVKEATAIGGNPVLVQAALEAMKRWEFEPAQEETTEVVQFTFAP